MSNPTVARQSNRMSDDARLPHPNEKAARVRNASAGLVDDSWMGGVAGAGPDCALAGGTADTAAAATATPQKSERLAVRQTRASRSGTRRTADQAQPLVVPQFGHL